MDTVEIIGEFLLYPIRKIPQLQVLFVIVIIPFIMNSIVFWVTDNFLKKAEFLQEEKDLIDSFYESKIPDVKASELVALSPQKKSRNKPLI